MIGDTEAPLQLPFAPKPFRGELFSSWLPRLAAANFVPLDELLSGLQARYPSAPYALSLDVELDEGFLLSMARFSRISVRPLRRLSLEKQISFPKATVLLRFNCNAGASQLLCRRLGYAFCPQCIARQSSVHVGWEWALACLLHCSVHGIPLCVGCPSCGELVRRDSSSGPGPVSVLRRNTFRGPRSKGPHHVTHYSRVRKRLSYRAVGGLSADRHAPWSKRGTVSKVRR
jgi:hypothetical protein